MTKSKFMRVAAVLMAAVLLTTCAISGTFAKYVSSASGSDTARVAKWGFGTSSLTIDLFDGTYTNVASSDSTNVIAPGTTKTATFTFAPPAAAPEVAYTFAVDTTGSACAQAIQDNTAITWSLDGTPVAADSTHTAWENLLTAIEALAGSGSYAAGALPTAFAGGASGSHTVTWAWAFEETGEGQPAAQDAIDTGMGNTAVASDLVCTLEIAITATQVD